MKTLKEIDEQGLSLRLGEAMAPILRAIDKEILRIQTVEGWVDGIIEMLAKQECKRRKEIPSWPKLTTAQKKQCRDRGKQTLQAIADFYNEKMNAATP